MSELKDHLWSLAAGAAVGTTIGAAAIGVIAAIGAAGDANGAAAIAGSLGAAGAATGAAAGADIGERTKKFQESSSISGVVLSLTTIFGTANHFGLFEKPETDKLEKTKIENKIPDSECKDIASMFNESNDNNNVKASVNNNGQYDLTVKSDNSQTLAIG